MQKCKKSGNVRRNRIAVKRLATEQLNFKVIEVTCEAFPIEHGFCVESALKYRRVFLLVEV